MKRFLSKMMASFNKPGRARPARKAQLWIENLEERALLSAVTSFYSPGLDPSNVQTWDPFQENVPAIATPPSDFYPSPAPNSMPDSITPVAPGLYLPDASQPWLP